MSDSVCTDHLLLHLLPDVSGAWTWKQTSHNSRFELLGPADSVDSAISIFQLAIELQNVSPISMICWARENLISHHHWRWSLTDIDALYFDGFLLIIPRLTQPSFSFLLPIIFMFILLAVILKCDTVRCTEFNQRLNMEAYPLTTA